MDDDECQMMMMFGCSFRPFLSIFFLNRIIHTEITHTQISIRLRCNLDLQVKKNQEHSIDKTEKKIPKKKKKCFHRVVFKHFHVMMWMMMKRMILIFMILLIFFFDQKTKSKHDIIIVENNINNDNQPKQKFMINLSWFSLICLFYVCFKHLFYYSNMITFGQHIFNDIKYKYIQLWSTRWPFITWRQIWCFHVWYKTRSSPSSSIHQWPKHTYRENNSFVFLKQNA